MEIGKPSSKPESLKVSAKKRTKKDSTVKNNDLELWFYAWLKEAKEHGLIKDYKSKPAPIVLSEAITISKQEVLKTKTVVKDKTLLNGCTYAADALILNPIDALGFLKQSKSYCDVKPPANSFKKSENSSYSNFSIKRKWLFQKYGLYVEKVVLFPVKPKYNSNDYLFVRTWTPKAYMDEHIYVNNTTYGKKGQSKIKLWKPITVEQYKKSINL